MNGVLIFSDHCSPWSLRIVRLSLWPPRWRWRRCCRSASQHAPLIKHPTRSDYGSDYRQHRSQFTPRGELFLAIIIVHHNNNRALCNDWPLCKKSKDRMLIIKIRTPPKLLLSFSRRRRHNATSWTAYLFFHFCSACYPSFVMSLACPQCSCPCSYLLALYCKYYTGYKFLCLGW